MNINNSLNLDFKFESFENVIPASVYKNLYDFSIIENVEI